MSQDREDRLSRHLPDSEKAVALSDRGLESEKSRSSSGRKLKIKIKLPDRRSCESDRMRDQDVEEEEEHVCTLCGKDFRSGKALGGHMRVHAQHRNRSDQLKTSTHHGGVDLAAAGCSDMDDADEVKGSCEDELQIRGGRKPICPICRRDFPSNKALFGHMRCHPERKWRGIQPPVYSSSSSTVSDDKSDNDEDGDHRLKKGVVDLENDLLNFGWGVKARRGREATSKSCASSRIVVFDNATVESIASDQAAGVQSLILLSRGDVDKETRKSEVGHEIKSRPSTAGPGVRDSINFIRNKLKICGAESRGRADHDSERREKRKTSQALTAEEVSDLTHSDKKFKFANEKDVEGSAPGIQHLMESDQLHQLTARRPLVSATNGNGEADVMSLEKDDASPHGYYNAAGLMQADPIETKKMHKVGKYLMISDLKPMSANLPHSSPVNSAHRQLINMEVPDNERYKCTTCYKTFSSHQALGGHKSSHNKLRNPQGLIRNDRPHPDNVTAQVGHISDVDAGASHNYSGLLMAAAAHPLHQCNVCFKIYPTGQALGGHKRLHCSLIINKASPLPPPSIVIPKPAEAALLRPPRSIIIITEPEAAPVHPHPAAPVAQASDNVHGAVCRFDLNELPALEDENDQDVSIHVADNTAAAQPHEEVEDYDDAHEPGSPQALLDHP